MLLYTYIHTISGGRKGKEGREGGEIYPAVHGPITTEICGIPSADTGYHSVVSLILLDFNLVLEGRGWEGYF